MRSPGFDFAPVSQTVSMPQLLVVHPLVKASTLGALLALAKSKPGDLNYSSSGTGSSSHLAMELLKYMTGAQFVHVPFMGSGQAMPSLLAGQVQLVFDPIPTSLPHVKSGRLRALAVTTTKRIAAAPETPTVAEAGLPGFEVVLWHGLVGPKGLPRAIVDRINTEANLILKAKEMDTLLATDGVAPAGGTPEQFAATIKSDIARWGGVVKQAGVKVD